jgi:hypothetical protein
MEQRTGKDVLSTEAIEVAAEWWTNSLRGIPNKDNEGKGKLSDGALLMTLASVAKGLPSESDLVGFKQALIEAIQNERVWGEYLSLGVDYFPEDCLAAAAKVAGISELAFSSKTRMHVYPNKIHLKAGYGADWEIIWRG